MPTLDQRGGGVLTVESLGGGVFDAIVYGEKQRSRWMAGSNNSVRTQNVDGPAETAKPGELIHVAIVYQADGRIALYRNGQPYGAAYAPANEKAGLHAYLAGKSRLLFGRRHTGGGNAFLRGEIEEARLYGFALTAAQIADSFKAGTLRGEMPSVATKDEKLGALRAQATQLRAKLDDIKRANGRLAESFQHEDDATYRLHAATFLRVGLKPKPAPSPRSEKPDWTLGDQSSASWLRHGNGLDGRFAPGDFRVEPAGADVLKHVLPSGLHSHTLSTKHSAVLTSPRFKVTTNFISVQAMGKGATLRLIPDNYPISTAGGSRFPKASIDSAKPTWITLDTAYRKGSYAYLELTLPEDSTNPDKKVEAQAGWYGVREVIFHATREAGPSGLAVIAQMPMLPTAGDVAIGLSEAAYAWGRDEASETQAALLDAGVRHGMLDASVTVSPKLAALTAEYRKLEAELTEPRRAPGFLEAEGFDMPLFVRGEYKQPGAVVAR
ncbi:MAG: LamG-like jellyroll fold domain-containing protein, partial [Verrucomicrobiota bacterium]